MGDGSASFFGGLLGGLGQQAGGFVEMMEQRRREELQQGREDRVFDREEKLDLIKNLMAIAELDMDEATGKRGPRGTRALEEVMNLIIPQKAGAPGPLGTDETGPLGGGVLPFIDPTGGTSGKPTGEGPSNSDLGVGGRTEKERFEAFGKVLGGDFEGFVEKLDLVGKVKGLFGGSGGTGLNQHGVDNNIGSPRLTPVQPGPSQNLRDEAAIQPPDAGDIDFSNLGDFLPEETQAPEAVGADADNSIITSLSNDPKFQKVMGDVIGFIEGLSAGGRSEEERFKTFELDFSEEGKELKRIANDPMLIIDGLESLLGFGKKSKGLQRKKKNDVYEALVDRLGFGPEVEAAAKTVRLVEKVAKAMNSEAPGRVSPEDLVQRVATGTGADLKSIIGLVQLMMEKDKSFSRLFGR